MTEDDRREVALEDIRFLSGSGCRLSLLEALAAEPGAPRELCDRLGVARSTLHRNLTELVDRGWIVEDRDANVYRLTEPGELVLETATTAVERFDADDVATRVRAHAGDALPLSPREFAGWSLTEVDDGPFAPVQRLIGAVQNAETFRGFARSVNPMTVETIAEEVPEDVDAEYVLGTDAVAALQSYARHRTEPLPDPDGRLLLAERLPPYALFLVDERPLVFLYDGSDRLAGLLVPSDETTPTEPFHVAYERTSEHARPLTPDQLAPP